MGPMRSRLIWVVTFVLAISFLGSNFVSYEMFRGAMRASVLDQQLPLTSDNIYSEIQADLVRPILISSLMANDTFVRDWVLEGEQDPEQMRRYLENIRERYGAFTAFFVSDKSRRYFHFTGVSREVERYNPRDGWFFRVSELIDDYEINVDHNEQQNDQVTIFINYRVFDYDDNFIGVTGVGLSLSSVAGLIERYRDLYHRDVFFVDQSGLIIIHPDPKVAQTVRLGELPGIGPHAAKILSNSRTKLEYELGGEGMLTTTRLIKELGWTVVVTQREADATGGVGPNIPANILIGFLAVAFTAVAIGMAINAHQRRLEEMATIDPLTGLYNRQIFDMTLSKAIERAARDKHPVALALMDLDHFKRVNDTFGHLVGDRTLKAAAGLLRGRVRESDVLARWGGEEFVLLMEGCALGQAREIAEAIRLRFEGADLLPDDMPDDIVDPGPKITISVGIAALVDGEAPNALLARADAALYAAKRAGRNRVEAG